MSICLDLRDETREEHRATEATPFAKSLARGSVDAVQFAQYLAVTKRLLVSLTAAIEACGDASVVPLGSAFARRVGLIERDLMQLGLPNLAAPVEAELVRLESSLLGLSSPALVGAAYVFEGSTLGGSVLAPRVERALGLAEGDLSYFRGGGDDPMRAWAAWKAGVDALALAEPSRSLVIHGAKMTFSGMRRVLAALLPAVVATTCAGAAPSMVV